MEYAIFLWWYKWNSIENWLKWTCGEAVQIIWGNLSLGNWFLGINNSIKLQVVACNKGKDWIIAAQTDHAGFCLLKVKWWGTNTPLDGGMDVEGDDCVTLSFTLVNSDVIFLHTWDPEHVKHMLLSVNPHPYSQNVEGVFTVWYVYCLLMSCPAL